jgi:hypothetical protein
MLVKNNGMFNFEDPETMQVFSPQATVEARKVTGWLKGQIEAGAFSEVKEDVETKVITKK